MSVEKQAVITFYKRLCQQFPIAGDLERAELATITQIGVKL